MFKKVLFGTVAGIAGFAAGIFASKKLKEYSEQEDFDKSFKEEEEPDVEIIFFEEDDDEFDKEPSYVPEEKKEESEVTEENIEEKTESVSNIPERTEEEAAPVEEIIIESHTKLKKTQKNNSSEFYFLHMVLSYLSHFLFGKRDQVIKKSGITNIMLGEFYGVFNCF